MTSRTQVSRQRRSLRTWLPRPRPRPRAVKSVLQDPWGQGHVLEDSIRPSLLTAWQQNAFLTFQPDDVLRCSAITIGDNEIWKGNRLTEQAGLRGTVWRTSPWTGSITTLAYTCSWIPSGPYIRSAYRTMLPTHIRWLISVHGNTVNM